MTGQFFNADNIAKELELNINLDKILQNAKFNFLIGTQQFSIKFSDLNCNITTIIQKIGKHNLYKAIISEKYPNVNLELYKVWIESMTPGTELSPSSDHFLGVVSGTALVFKRNDDYFGGHNPRASPFETGYWMRWPTKDEMISMLANIDDFSFGVPPKPHLHGN
uniref:Uncharacterized protein n=1 Tax=Marseillevirus LCMAC201 TaxID=2506605 RepID=A0A481YYD6_9VIRU|nr:MAG: hypothetical protein LCMAC201_04670 [Marseillevirus LCMAC201]